MPKRKDKENLVVDIQFNDTQQTVKKSENLTITTALIQIIEQAKNSRLSEDFWKTCESPLAYLHEQWGLSDMQIVFLSAMLEEGGSVSLYDFSQFLGISCFKAMIHKEEFDSLILDGWVKKYSAFCVEQYSIVDEIKTAISHDMPFKPSPKKEEQEPDENDDIDCNDVKDCDDVNDSNSNSNSDNDEAAKRVSGFTIMKSHVDIKGKAMFYNAQEEKQIERVADMLSVKKLSAIQQRLEESGMRKGVACLFYGGPGTGKTESVLQIARQTGRDIMQVDIAGVRDMFAGEGEKNVKAIFAHYRKVCQESKVTPILFFNEADAIFNKRSRIEQYCDKEENSMQNIILQEMENLEGILIATTNLTSNLDKAFERRFLYKIEFHKPSIEVKVKIWRSMLKDLSEDDARLLATHYDFSGGQIENIARKHIVENILTGRRASFEEIEDRCRMEVIYNTGNKKKERMHIVGFKSY